MKLVHGTFAGRKATSFPLQIDLEHRKMQLLLVSWTASNPKRWASLLSHHYLLHFLLKWLCSQLLRKSCWKSWEATKLFCSFLSTVIQYNCNMFENLDCIMKHKICVLQPALPHDTSFVVDLSCILHMKSSVWSVTINMLSPRSLIAYPSTAHSNSCTRYTN